MYFFFPFFILDTSVWNNAVCCTTPYSYEMEVPTYLEAKIMLFLSLRRVMGPMDMFNIYTGSFTNVHCEMKC